MMIDVLYIKVTENCNLQCSFCYVRQQKNVIKQYDIDRCMNAYRPRKMVFHGGEPLLYPAIITAAAKQYPAVQKCITSNLTLPLTPERLEAIALCDIATSYSVDRFDEQQFKLFCSNVKAVQATTGVTLLVTLSEEQLKQAPAELAHAIRLINPANITFERLYMSGTTEVLEALYRATDNYLMELFEYIDNQKNNLRLQMQRAIQMNVPVFDKHCNDYVRTLNPDGSVCSCPNLYLQNGAVFKKRTECLLCNLYAYCAGDCLSFQKVCSFPKQTFTKLLGGEET